MILPNDITTQCIPPGRYIDRNRWRGLQRVYSLRDGILVEAACARERGGQALAQHLWARVRRQAQGVEARAGRW